MNTLVLTAQPTKCVKSLHTVALNRNVCLGASATMARNKPQTTATTTSSVSLGVVNQMFVPISDYASQSAPPMLNVIQRVVPLAIAQLLICVLEGRQTATIVMTWQSVRV